MKAEMISAEWGSHFGFPPAQKLWLFKAQLWGRLCHISLGCRIKGTKDFKCLQKVWAPSVHNDNSICCLYIMSSKGFTDLPRENTVVSITSMCNKKKKTTEKWKGEKNKIHSAPFWFCILKDQLKAFLSTKISLPLVYNNSSPGAVHFPGRSAPGLRICLCFISISAEGTTGFEDWLSSSGGKAWFLWEGTMSHSTTLMKPTDFLRGWHQSAAELGAVGPKWNNESEDVMGKVFCWNENF